MKLIAVIRLHCSFADVVTRILPTVKGTIILSRNSGKPRPVHDAQIMSPSCRMFVDAQMLVAA